MSRLWLPPGAADRLESRSATSAPDLAPFVRAHLGLLGGGRLSGVLEGWAMTHGAQHTDPRLVPLEALRAMGSHPVVYLAERTIGGIVRRPDLYYVRHTDKRIVRETEAWLWPLLPDLLAAAAHAFAYGSVPVVLDWGRRDLRIQVPSEDGRVRSRRLPLHTHYVAAHEVWPGDVEVEADRDALRALRHGGRRYAADRAHLFVWDREFGGFEGQGARRRAWRDFVTSLGVSVLQVQYLERSVDSPRVVWAPPGTQPVDGQDVPTTDYVATLLRALRGSGAVAFPSVRDGLGNRRYDLETLDVPDRGDVWDQAMNRYDGGILKAYLVPPSLTGVEDLAATGARVLDGMLREFIQDLAQFAADALTRLVRIVHAMNHDPAAVEPPDVLAYEIPASIRKLYLEVLRLVGAAQTGEPASAWVDVPALLDQLGVPLRTSPLAIQPTTDAPGAPTGRPRDMAGEREERREAARTAEGAGEAQPEETKEETS